MASSTLSNNFGSVFHKILGAVWTDEMAKTTPKWPEYLDEKTTEKKYFDDIEITDPGLWNETEEAAAIDLDDYGEGIKTRYEPKKFAKRLIIPEELMEDAQYDQAYDATRMMARTCQLTQDYDAVGVINSMFDATVTGGDLQPLGSAVHPIRGGATVSNILSPALSPSNTAVQQLLIVAEKMPGTNGFVHGVKLMKIICPTNQRFRFKEILKSETKDDTANRSINALVGELNNTPVAVPFMSSTTNYWGKTNAMRGLMFFWRRKPRYRNMGDINNETKVYTGSARWAKGWSNWRGAICVQA